MRTLICSILIVLGLPLLGDQPTIPALGKHWIVKSEVFDDSQRHPQAPKGIVLELEDGSRLQVASVPLGEKFYEWYMLADALKSTKEFTLDRSDSETYPFMMSDEYGRALRVRLKLIYLTPWVAPKA